jgi:hypothetical protein
VDMTRKLKKEIWPYSSFFKTVTDEHGFEVDDEQVQAREQWLWDNLQENIRSRVYVVHESKGATYYFQREKDYQWFIWRWI